MTPASGAWRRGGRGLLSSWVTGRRRRVVVAPGPVWRATRRPRTLATVKKTVLLYGAAAGALILVLRLSEYRFLVVDHALQVYGAIVAVLFTALGAWLGLRLTRPASPVVVREVVVTPPPAEPFVPDAARLARFGITGREHEILGLIAEGLSTREIATRLGVSENTVKTHTSRVLAKLEAKRRTQAVQRAKAVGLIP